LAGLLFSSLASLGLTVRFVGIVGKAHPVKPLINFSYPLYLSGILTFAANWVDQLFVLPYMGKAYLGMYHIAVRAAVVPSLISTSIVTALFPKLSELYTKGGAESLRNSFRIATRYTVLTGFPMIVGVAVLAQPILLLFAGVEYAEAGLPLAIICLASLPGALGITIAPSLMTLERTKMSLVLNLARILSKTAVSYITLAYLDLGMIGTSSSRVLAALAGFALGVYALGRSITVTFERDALWKASLASAIMVISIILSRSLNLERFFPQLYLLPLYMLAGAIVYFFSLVALRAIKKEDVDLFHDYLPGPLKKVALWLGRVAFVE
jgi:O-antigen/teichoic acid export membrane protein